MKTAIKKIDGKWYAFGVLDDEVCSIGADDPKQPGCFWIARACNKGIQYVATPSPNRSAAYKKAKRWGEYRGEW